MEDLEINANFKAIQEQINMLNSKLSAIEKNDNMKVEIAIAELASIIDTDSSKEE